MNPKKTASQSGKTATATSGSSKGETNPFDQIVLQEQKEQERVQTETTAMEQEFQHKKQEFEDKVEKAEQEYKEEAKKELREYKETDLAKILDDAEKDAAATTEKLDDAYKAKGKDLAKKLADQLLTSYTA